MSTGTITTLRTHPIKGCRAIQAQSVRVVSTGLLWDRAWMVVRASDGKYLSQREQSKLALVQPDMPTEALTAVDAKSPPAGSSLTVTAPGMAKPLAVPLQLPAKPQTRVVTVWEWTGLGVDEGEEAAQWFTTYLGLPARLVRYLGTELDKSLVSGTTDPVVRPTDPEFADQSETRFSDGFPLLLANEASLEDLNKRLLASPENAATMDGLLPLPMARFRPNIVVGGAPAWEEDKWRVVRVEAPASGDKPVDLQSVKPCSRCKVTTIDPNTGNVSAGEPLDILATFRSGSQLGYKEKSWKHAVHFAWNLVPPAQTSSVLTVGDRVSFLQPQKEF